jgi:hypothetical protein
VTASSEKILYTYSCCCVCGFVVFPRLLMLKKPVLPTPSSPKVALSVGASVVKTIPGAFRKAGKPKKAELNQEGELKMVTCSCT